jgi:hypothetical protein
MASMGSNLSGGGGELRFVVQIKRAATGETETHELVGKITDEQAKELNLKEKEHGGNALDSGA